VDYPAQITHFLRHVLGGFGDKTAQTEVKSGEKCAAAVCDGVGANGRVLTARDVAYQRTRGFMRPNKKPRPEACTGGGLSLEHLNTWTLGHLSPLPFSAAQLERTLEGDNVRVVTWSYMGTWYIATEGQRRLKSRADKRKWWWSGGVASVRRPPLGIHIIM